MKDSEIVININEIDRKLIEQGAEMAGTDVQTYLICSAVRRACQEEDALNKFDVAGI